MIKRSVIILFLFLVMIPFAYANKVNDRERLAELLKDSEFDIDYGD